MAKGKARGQKQKNVFHVANSKTVKAKNKAKPVKTNLKKIHIATAVSTVNKAFTAIQKDVSQLKKGNPSKHMKKNVVSKSATETPDIDNTADLLSQL